MPMPAKELFICGCKLNGGRRQFKLINNDILQIKEDEGGSWTVERWRCEPLNFISTAAKSIVQRL